MEWGSVANWVSGIGSLVASCVALFIAERGRRIKLDGYVGKRVMIGGGSPRTNVLAISVTNVGSRVAKISNVGMTYGGKRRRRAAIISVSIPDLEHPWLVCDKIPLSIEDGESANWFIYLGDDDKWIVDLVGPGHIETWTDVETLRFIVYTSQGHRKINRPDLELRQQLHELVQRHIAAIGVN